MCEGRYALLKINHLQHRPMYDYIIIGDGYYLFMPTLDMVELLSGDDITGCREIVSRGYFKLFLPNDKFTSILFNLNGDSIVLIIDTWDFSSRLGSDFVATWGKEGLSEEELSNVIDTITAINLDLIDDVDVLNKLITHPEKIWINEYIYKLPELLENGK